MKSSGEQSEARDSQKENKTKQHANVSRDAEIESIKRTLYNAIDKLERLKSNQ